MAIVTVGGVSYHIDDKIIPKWDLIKNGYLAEKDDDRVFIVDGRERAGKSLFTIQQAAYIDSTIIEGDIPRICFDSDDFLHKIRNTKSTKTQTKVVVYDEAFRGLSSRAVMSKTNKKIVQALMEMGQNNLVVFIVLPSFFLLDIYPAILRSECLFHVFKDKKANNRAFRIFNYQKKAKLYRDGTKKGWGYKVFSPLAGRFGGKKPGGDEFWEKYLKKKQESFREHEKETFKTEEESRLAMERKILLVGWWNFMKKYHKMSQTRFIELLKPAGISFTPDNITFTLRNVAEQGKVLNFDGKDKEIYSFTSDKRDKQPISEDQRPKGIMKQASEPSNDNIDGDSEPLED